MVFVTFITGEATHWDEVGFAVPWHISETFQAFGLSNYFGYNFSDLLSVMSATTKLSQIYAVHIALAPILIVAFAGLHIYLVKTKGISIPFWKKESGEKAPFWEHVKIWLIGGAIIFIILLVVAAVIPRDPGIPPQNLPTSPLYGSKAGPGGLGFKPSFPISWTHGMNVFVDKYLGIKPDIWGTISAMTFGAIILLIIPFIDRGEEPRDKSSVLNWKKRAWAFLAMTIFWAIFVIGVITNALAGPG